jgi:hypothetical protein
MRRLPLFMLVATIAIFVAVGGVLATTHGTRTSEAEPGTATTTVTDSTVPALTLAADVPSSQPEAKATATPRRTKSKPATQAESTSGGGRANYCRDDCGDPGDASCGTGADLGHGSTGIVDDDRDGDGGDCGEGD